MDPRRRSPIMQTGSLQLVLQVDFCHLSFGLGPSPTRMLIWTPQIPTFAYSSDLYESVFLFLDYTMSIILIILLKLYI